MLASASDRYGCTTVGPADQFLAERILGGYASPAGNGRLGGMKMFINACV
jgi:hypothetical protein